MTEHHEQFRLSRMCRVLRVQPSGWCVWKAHPKSDRTLADEAMQISIKQFLEDGQVIHDIPYGHGNLREEGIRCGGKRVRAKIFTPRG